MLRWAFIAVIVTGAAGCAVAPPPAVTINTSLSHDFKELQAATAPVATTSSIDEWWRAYDSPGLDRLIEAGLAANRDLATAVARLREARSVARALDASRLPSLDLVANRDRQKSLVFPDGFIDRREIGVSLAWEPDVFGRLAQRVDASASLAAASEAELEAVRSLLRNDIARAYLELRDAQEHRRLAELSVALWQGAIRAADTFFQHGQATPQQRDEARMAHEDALSLSAQWQGVYRERLQVVWRLVGGSLDLSAIDGLLKADAPRPLGSLVFPEELPSQVLERRPDVRRTAHAARAAAAGTKAARYDLLPALRIAFTPLHQRIAVTGFDPARGEVFVAGLGLRLPVFDRPRLHAEVEAADARLAQAIAQYEQTVIQAFSEVEMAAAALVRLRAQLTYAEQTSQGAEQRLHATNRQFDVGLAGYNDKLEARREWLNRQEAATEAAISARLGEIALARALGY